jgi:hypothetical protein
MGSWVEPYMGSIASLTPGGITIGGPVNAGGVSDQPLPDRNGDLRMNYSCGGACGCGCIDTPMPSGEGSEGIEDDYLCLYWLGPLVI